MRRGSHAYLCCVVINATRKTALVRVQAQVVVGAGDALLPEQLFTADIFGAAVSSLSRRFTAYVVGLVRSWFQRSVEVGRAKKGHTHGRHS